MGMKCLLIQYILPISPARCDGSEMILFRTWRFSWVHDRSTHGFPVGSANNGYDSAGLCAQQVRNVRKWFGPVVVQESGNSRSFTPIWARGTEKTRENSNIAREGDGFGVVGHGLIVRQYRKHSK